MTYPLVKILHKTGNLSRQLPDNAPIWDGLHYTLNASAKKYDWLVVYDDIPANRKERFWKNPEILSCPPENTILLTHEPSAVKIHGADFTSQFAVVVTCHEQWALRHRHKIAAHPASPWWYGASSNTCSYDSLRASILPEKTKTISTVCSRKQQRHTLHRQRFAFTQKLQAELPHLDVFGHGIRFIDDKTTALDSYRYHVVVENHICPHYWTEKLADAFLGGCLPFYCGCPNAADYFPEDSFIAIDIRDFDRALAVIRATIADNTYEKRLAAITEARRRVLEEHNFFSLVSRVIHNLTKNATNRRAGKNIIYNRSALWKKNPFGRLRYLCNKTSARIRNYYNNR